MIGLKLLVAGTDYTADLQFATVTWSGDSLPRCDLTLDNQTGKFAAVPLFSPVALTLPNSVGTFNFLSEEHSYRWRPGGGRGAGRTAELRCTAAPELIFLTEGNLDVVGTDLPVGKFADRGSTYVPYVSTFIQNLGAPLMDVGGILTALLHAPQPNQGAGFRGRLGYDCTGQGVKSATGIDYPAGPAAIYVKGMWQIGLGATGAQRTGVDLVNEVLTKNLIDGAGNQAFMDWYVDPTVSPPVLKAFQRGSVSSGVTVAVGGDPDPVQELELPVDTTDVRNFIVYWANTETSYPNGGDSWGNYPDLASRSTQWSDAAVQGAGAITISADTPFSQGTSVKYADSSTSADFEVASAFNIGPNGYAPLAPARNVLAVQTWFKRQFGSNALTTDALKVQLADAAGNAVANSNASQTSIQQSFGWPTNQWKLFTVATPPSGRGDWQLVSGSWDFATSTIAKLTLTPRLSATGVAGSPQAFWFDYVSFADNWGFSPDYSYNTAGATATVLTSPALGGGTVLNVVSTSGYVAGQFAVVGVTAVGQEVLKVASVSPQLLVLSTPLANTHAAGQIVVGGTHDPNSIAAYGNRIFNFVDFYLSSGQSDAAASIADSILQSRKGKKSTGRLKMSGYAKQVPSITPRSLFTITDPKDVYTGGAADAPITSWVADTIEYGLVPDAAEGFTATYTVEPFFSSIGASSPDTNRRNLWRQVGVAGLVARLNRTSQYFGGQR